MGEYSPERKSLGGRVKAELDYAIKTDLKILIGVYTSKILKIKYLVLLT